MPSQSEIRSLLVPRCDQVEESIAEVQLYIQIIENHDSTLENADVYFVVCQGMSTVTWSSLYADTWATTTFTYRFAVKIMKIDEFCIQNDDFNANIQVA